MRFAIVFTLVLMLIGCSIPRLTAESMPVSKPKKQCMELAEVTCTIGETCQENFDWNDCMIELYSSVCRYVDGIGPDYEECYMAVSRMECGDIIPKPCSRAFIHRTSQKEM